jgi:multiple sugar transport system substrate-binding protein
MSRTLNRRDFLKTAAAAAGALVVSSCAPATTAPTTAPTSAPAATKPAAATTAPAALKGKLTILFHGTTSPLDSPYWATRLKMFTDANPGVEIVSLGAENDEAFTQKVTTMVAGGTPPDMVKISGGRLIATAVKGIYEDLEPRVKASAQMSKIIKLLPSEGKELRVCGKQYALPMDIEQRLWIYNQDLFDKMGVAYPKDGWTWEDLLALGKAMNKAEDNQYLVSPGVTSFQDYADWVWQAGGTIFNEDGTHVNLSETPNVKAMQFVVDLFKKYKYAPAPGLKLGDIGVTFDTGKFALNMAHTGTMAAQLSKPTWKFKWSAVFAPKGPANANGFTKSNGWGIPKGTKTADLAWSFIEWWYSDPIQTKFAEMGELVPRSDLRDSVALKALPEHLRPAMLASSKNARGLERFPGWDVSQRNWKNELDTAITGDISVEQAMQTADKKAESEVADLMATVCK